MHGEGSKREDPQTSTILAAVCMGRIHRPPLFLLKYAWGGEGKQEGGPTDLLYSCCSMHGEGSKREDLQTSSILTEVCMGREARGRTYRPPLFLLKYAWGGVGKQEGGSTDLHYSCCSMHGEDPQASSILTEICMGRGREARGRTHRPPLFLLKYAWGGKQEGLLRHALEHQRSIQKSPH